MNILENISIFTNVVVNDYDQILFEFFEFWNDCKMVFYFQDF